MIKINNNKFILEKEESAAKISRKKEKKFLVNYAESISSDIESILIIPPDYTRKHSGAGRLTKELYKLLADKYEVAIMPALGTHKAMTDTEIKDMFGTEIPLEKFIVHDFRNETESIGEIPANFVEKLSEGKFKTKINLSLNKRIINDEYELIISIGQVLPHGVVGMSNYNKNILVGCGGPDIINVSHYLGAVYGIERLLGKGKTPVRELYNYAEKNFLPKDKIDYILTVNSSTVNEKEGSTDLLGIYIGNSNEIFYKAVEMSKKNNINKVSEAIEKLVVYMDEKEFKSTWLSCKAIYRTRLAIADGGELIVIAPGLKEFGEYKEVDKLIRKYGYNGSEKIIEFVKNNTDLQNNLSAAAHLIHGSTEGRFKVTFATDKLTKKELRSVNHDYMALNEALEKYPISKLNYGFNKLADGEKIFFIDNPTTGLWTT